MTDEKFYLVLLPESGEPQLRAFDTDVGLAAFLRALPPASRGYAFRGERLFVTTGQFRFLLVGDKQLPLFDAPKLGKQDTSDRLGFGPADDGLDPEYKKLMASLPPPPGGGAADAAADDAEP